MSMTNTNSSMVGGEIDMGGEGEASAANLVCYNVVPQTQVS